VRAWHQTYGLPTLVTNCGNNYGPYQFPEKLIPLMILNALEGKPLPVYGDGLNVRDWLYVSDHCTAIQRVLASGRIGQTYNIGGGCERRNVEVVRAICAALGALRPRRAVTSRRSVRARSSWPRPALRDRCEQDRRRTRLAAAGNVRKRTFEDGPLVPGPPGLGGERPRRSLSPMDRAELRRTAGGRPGGIGLGVTSFSVHRLPGAGKDWK